MLAGPTYSGYDSSDSFTGPSALIQPGIDTFSSRAVETAALHVAEPTNIHACISIPTCNIIFVQVGF